MMGKKRLVGALRKKHRGLVAWTVAVATLAAAGTAAASAHRVYFGRTSQGGVVMLTATGSGTFVFAWTSYSERCTNGGRLTVRGNLVTVYPDRKGNFAASGRYRHILTKPRGQYINEDSYLSGSIRGRKASGTFKTVTRWYKVSNGAYVGTCQARWTWSAHEH